MLFLENTQKEHGQRIDALHAKSENIDRKVSKVNQNVESMHCTDECCTRHAKPPLMAGTRLGNAMLLQKCCPENELLGKLAN